MSELDGTDNPFLNKGIDIKNMARPVGASNRNKAFLNNRLRNMYGEDFDAIMKIAENAVNIQAIVDEKWSLTTEEIQKLKIEDLRYAFAARKEAIDAWDKVAVYTVPKLKPINPLDLPDDTEAFTIDFSGFNEEEDRDGRTDWIDEQAKLRAEGVNVSVQQRLNEAELRIIKAAASISERVGIDLGALEPTFEDQERWEAIDSSDNVECLAIESECWTETGESHPPGRLEDN